MTREEVVGHYQAMKFHWLALSDQHRENYPGAVIGAEVKRWSKGEFEIRIGGNRETTASFPSIESEYMVSGEEDHDFENELVELLLPQPTIKSLAARIIELEGELTSLQENCPRSHD